MTDTTIMPPLRGPRDELLFLAITEFGRIGYLARHRQVLQHQIGNISALTEAFALWDRAETALLDLHNALADVEIEGLIPVSRAGKNRVSKQTTEQRS
jgi:hypothetical protein